MNNSLSRHLFYKYYISLFLVCVINQAYSQKTSYKTFKCGTVSEEMREGANSRSNSGLGSLQYGPNCTNYSSDIPETFGLIRIPFRIIEIQNDNGLDVWSSFYTESLKDVLNNEFRSLNIEFYEINENTIQPIKDSKLFYFNYGRQVNGLSFTNDETEIEKLIKMYNKENDNEVRYPLNIVLTGTVYNKFGEEIGGKATFPGDGNLITLPAFRNIEGGGVDHRELVERLEGLIHELGHFLGLYHTFETGAAYYKFIGYKDEPNALSCSKGDLISDTYGELESDFEELVECISFCNLNASANSVCSQYSNFSGGKMISNYMSYFTGCRGEFTEFQQRKMWDIAAGTHDGLELDVCNKLASSPSISLSNGNETIPLVHREINPHTYLCTNTVTLNAFIPKDGNHTNTNNMIEWEYAWKDNYGNTRRETFDKLANSITINGSGPNNIQLASDEYAILARQVAPYNRSCKGRSFGFILKVDNNHCLDFQSSIIEPKLESRSRQPSYNTQLRGNDCSDNTFDVEVYFTGSSSLSYTIEAKYDNTLLQTIYNANPYSWNNVFQNIPKGKTVTVAVHEENEPYCQGDVESITYNCPVVSGCSIPINLNYQILNSSDVRFFWDNVPGVISYQLCRSYDGILDYDCQYVTSNSFLISGYNGNTTEYFKVRSRCGTTNYSSFSGYRKFVVQNINYECSVKTSIDAPKEGENFQLIFDITKSPINFGSGLESIKIDYLANGTILGSKRINNTELNNYTNAIHGTINISSLNEGDIFTYNIEVIDNNTYQACFNEQEVVIQPPCLNTTFYRDLDGDGYGSSFSQFSCYQPDGFVLMSGDCDDNNGDINPGRNEICDDLDNNCNGQIDEGLLSTYYYDRDQDGYGSSIVKMACSQPPFYVTNSDDCDDFDENIHPNVTEICDGKDNNCNGSTDESVGTTFYEDFDNDGYGASSGGATYYGCVAPVGYVEDNQDCDDTNPNVYPGAAETCDGLDNNCNGNIDDPITLVTPSGVDIINITGSSVTMIWEFVNGAEHYEIAYTSDEGDNWTYINNITTNYHKITNLPQNTFFHVALKAHECNSSSNWINSTFRTKQTLFANLTHHYNEIEFTGNQINLDATIINNGEGTASTSEVKFYLSSDIYITTADYFIGTDDISYLPVNATFDSELQTLVSNLNIPDGSYYAGYIIDQQNVITELNELDNVYVYDNKIAIGYCPTPEGLSVNLDNLGYSATLNWNKVTTTANYSVFWRLHGGTWEEIPIPNSNNFVTLYNALQPGIKYQWYVKVECSNISQPSYSPLKSFITPGYQENKVCEAPIITCGGTYSGTTSNSAFYSLQDDCGSGGLGARNEFYLLRGNNKDVSLSFCNSNYDTRVDVYRILDYTCSVGATFQCVTGNDDYCETQSRVDFWAESNYDYYIMVHGYNSSSGNFEFSVDCNTHYDPITNSECLPNSNYQNPDGQALNLPVFDLSSSSQNLPYLQSFNHYSTIGINNPSCDKYGQIKDVWFKFNSGNNSTVTIQTKTGNFGYGSPANNINLAVYDACGGNEVACSVENYYLTLNELTNNKNYFVRAWSSASDAGDFEISIFAGCPDVDFLVFSNTPLVESGFYYSNYQIRSSGEVKNNRNVTFKAGNAIIFEPGFEASLGSQVHAFIGSCSLSAIQEEPDIEVSRVLNEVKKPVFLALDKAALQVMPNPLFDEATIRFYTPKESQTKILIFDLNGQLLTEKNSDSTQGWNTTRLDASNLPAGMYYVTLHTEGSILTEKIMILK